MAVHSLGYVRVMARDLAVWRRFAVDAVGMGVGESADGSLWLRTDDRPFRFRIEQGDTDRFIAAGWELPGEAAFQKTVGELRAAGVALREGSPVEAKARCVSAFVTGNDPDGNIFELYWGRFRAYDPFVSARGVSGFVVGDLGAGHVVLPAPQLETTTQFYKTLLGFDDTDEMRLAMSPDPAVPELCIRFLHATCRRHHSLALIPMPVPSGLVHTMVEMREIDDVGRALDRGAEGRQAERDAAERHRWSTQSGVQRSAVANHDRLGARPEEDRQVTAVVAAVEHDLRRGRRREGQKGHARRKGKRVHGRVSVTGAAAPPKRLRSIQLERTAKWPFRTPERRGPPAHAEGPRSNLFDRSVRDQARRRRMSPAAPSSASAPGAGTRFISTHSTAASCSSSLMPRLNTTQNASLVARPFALNSNVAR